MKDKFWAIWAILWGKNSKHTSKNTILTQTQERRLLPVGRQEFDEWSDRIISGTLLQADPDSQKFALGQMLLHLSPTEAAKDDAFFISSLRKFAVNQVADAVCKEIRDKAKARLAAEDAERLAKEEAIKKDQDALAAATLARLENNNKLSAVTPTDKGVADGKEIAS